MKEVAVHDFAVEHSHGVRNIGEAVAPLTNRSGGKKKQIEV